MNSIVGKDLWREKWGQNDLFNEEYGIYKYLQDN